ncbi:MAG: nitroreductase family deazaflavin-dependent oxidoreductase [Thermomicrobiales bacterium]
MSIVQASDATLPDDLASRSVCYLTTTGRISGKAHEIEIWFAARGGALYILSGGRDRSDWVKNVKREPRVSIRFDGQTFAGTAEIIEGADEDLIARQTVVAKYYGWRDGPLPNAWARDSLPVAIRLSPITD